MTTELIKVNWSEIDVVIKPFTLTLDQLRQSHPSALIDAPVESHYTNPKYPGVTIIPVWFVKDCGGDLYLDGDIKVIISNEHNGVVYTIQHELMLITRTNEFKNLSKEQKITRRLLRDNYTQLASRVFKYDNLVDEYGRGSGPFAFKTTPSGTSLSSISNKKKITLAYVIKSVSYTTPKDKVAIRIFEHLNPELFRSQIENQKKHYKNLLDQNVLLKEQQKSLDEELIATNKAIIENEEFNTLNSENSRLNQESDRIQTMMRSDDERASELRERLKNFNFTRFITNIDKMSENDIAIQLNKLTHDELIKASIKIVYLKQSTMVERIDNDLCGLCFTNDRNAVISPCNHRFFCNDCTSVFASSHKICPMCCQPYNNIVNLKLTDEITA